MKPILVLFIVIVSFMGLAHSCCCGTMRINFTLKNRNQHSCYDIPGATIARTFGTGRTIGTNMADLTGNDYLGNCEVEICGDGKAVSGTYCGVGPCNVLGCNCDGGCIPGNAIRNFMQLYGHMVTNVYRNPTAAEYVGITAGKMFNW